MIPPLQKLLLRLLLYALAFSLLRLVVAAAGFPKGNLLQEIVCALYGVVAGWSICRWRQQSQ